VVADLAKGPPIGQYNWIDKCFHLGYWAVAQSVTPCNSYRAYHFFDKPKDWRVNLVYRSGKFIYGYNGLLQIAETGLRNLDVFGYIWII
jgi:hypothetical protein